MKNTFKNVAIALLILSAVLVALRLSVRAQQSSAATPIQQTATMSNAATNVLSTNLAINTAYGTPSITPPGNQYVYITAIDLAVCQAATGTAATNVTFNFTAGIAPSGTLPIWQLSTAAAPEVCVYKFIPYSPALKSISPGTAVTFSGPTNLANDAYQTNVYYYFGQ